MTLLERRSQLTELANSAALADRGQGQLVLVTGEAGAGKSVLIESFAGDLLDARWLWGACDGLFTPRPLGPLFDIAEQLGGDLLTLIEAGADRDVLFRALLRSITAGPALNVVVVEDIHWADEATLDLLRFLARRIRAARVLLIVTFRDEGSFQSDSLRRALGELVTQGPSNRIELDPLSIDAIQSLIERDGRHALSADKLYQLTGGNPFFVTEVLRATAEAVPATARDVILSRAARLSPESRQALDAAALIGSRIVDVSLLQTAAPESAVQASVVDELVASGLLVITEDGALRFRHEIARLAVESTVPAHRRVVIHRRILHALQQAGHDDDARLAFHAEHAGDAAATFLHASRAATRAAELSSHREAVAQYQRALRFASTIGAADVARLYDLLSVELALVDRWAEAAEAGEHALELWRAVGERRREGDTLRRLGHAMWRLCRGREAGENAMAALTLLEPLGPSIELAWAYANLAGYRMANNDSGQAATLARQAQAIATPLAAFDVLSDALNTEGYAALFSGGDWLGPLTQALDIAVSNNREEQAGRAFVNLYELYLAQLHLAKAQQHIDDGVAYSDEHDIGTYATCLRGGQTRVFELSGRWDEAETLASSVLASCGPSSINRIHPLQTLAAIRSRRGEPDAEQLLDELIQATDGTGGEYVVGSRLIRAEGYWLKGNTQLARREVELARDVSASCSKWERGAIAVWLRRTESVRTASVATSPRPSDPADVDLDLPEPYRSQIAGDYRRASNQWAERDCPYEAALALIDSDDEHALREALATFDNLNAPATASITRHKMRGLGFKSIPAGRRQSTRSHPLGLTARECEVLELICDGHTNLEIAAELFLSPRTVAHHVSAILAKLDTPTRNAAATRANQLGLTAVS